MPIENIKGLVEDGRVKILSLPRLSFAITMNNRKLIRVLRFCPLSDLFGCPSKELNE